MVTGSFGVDMFGRDRDPRQARYLTLASLRWVLRHRAWTPWYLLRYWRFLRFKLRNPHVVTEGFVFLGRGVEVYARRGYGRLVLGRWVHVGDGTAIRCHEGNLRIGDKAVFGRYDTVNCYLDIEIGAAALISDWIYICDFDHRFADLATPIKDQGIEKTPVRIGPDVWIGTKASVLRGTRVGQGCVIAAHAVVTRDVPPHSVVVGSPARVVGNRVEDYEAAAAHRAALADIARKTAQANRPDAQRATI
ncbi:MAG: acyltransferase [Carbonactinosporaceae bacterium]